jgi:hypothetical protein
MHRNKRVTDFSVGLWLAVLSVFVLHGGGVSITT